MKKAKCPKCQWDVEVHLEGWFYDHSHPDPELILCSGSGMYADESEAQSVSDPGGCGGVRTGDRVGQVTPDDVARYRAFAEPGSNEWVLLDALEAAWAERDEAYEVHADNHSRQADYWRERAERAEAELLSAQVLLEGSTTRAERANEDYNRIAAERDEYLKRFRAADAALARVRDLCAQPDVALLNVNVIRAAIEGDNP